MLTRASHAQVTLAVGDAELLAGAHLRLTAGTRYGLVGRQASRPHPPTTHTHTHN